MNTALLVITIIIFVFGEGVESYVKKNMGNVVKEINRDLKTIARCFFILTWFLVLIGPKINLSGDLASLVLFICLLVLLILNILTIPMVFFTKGPGKLYFHDRIIAIDSNDHIFFKLGFFIRPN